MSRPLLLLWATLVAALLHGERRHFSSRPRVFCQGLLRHGHRHSQTLGRQTVSVRAVSDGVYDPWDVPPVAFRGLGDMRNALAQPDLLQSWGKHARDILTMFRATAGRKFDLSGAMYVAYELGPLHIYLIGETGAGKSSLVRALAEGVTDKAANINVSATTKGTLKTTVVQLPSGLVLVDTRGFRIPIPPSKEKPWYERIVMAYTYSRQLAQWECSLDLMKRIIKETDPRKRPASVVLYTHKAGSRLVVDRLVEILSVPLKGNVPTFFVLSDVRAVDDKDLIEIRDVVSDIISKVGVNDRGQRVQMIEVNSSPKIVQEVMFKESGLTELVAGILNALRPVDVLQFVRKAKWYR